MGIVPPGSAAPVKSSFYETQRPEIFARSADTNGLNTGSHPSGRAISRLGIGRMTGGTPDGAITEEGEKITEPSCFQENFSGEYKTIRPGASKFPALKSFFYDPCESVLIRGLLIA